MQRLAFCLLLACCLWSAAAQAQPYTFTTLAGKPGVPGHDDGTGSQALLELPGQLTLDRAGNLYVMQSESIRKVTPGGVVSTFNTNPDAVGWAMDMDSAGNLYVTMGQQVIKLTPEGVVSIVAGHYYGDGQTDGIGTNASFYTLRGIVMDSAGTLYVTDDIKCTIRKITPEGVVSTFAGSPGTYGFADGTGSDARFYYPRGITVDRADNLYVADPYNHTIRKITPGGEVSTFAGSAGNAGCADGEGANAQFCYPEYIAVDSATNLYVTEPRNHTIRKITPAGVVSTIGGLPGHSGSADGTGSAARFYSPRGIAVDSAGNLYVADIYNHTIRMGRPIVVTPPSLGFSLVAKSLILSWPLSAANYVLETSSSVTPGAIWTPVTSPVGTSGNSFVLTNSLEGSARFYRLRKP